ncbi:hypothetical protein [Bacteroides thetaiotaomicron]|uniref:hypothetical protein n=1 Tax=Bacteroides thetaiotaomicron TaxID=818 RepID=UPI0015595A0E|nr:hypothetical protein [Bacteroides thetaiotaomicron]
MSSNSSLQYNTMPCGKDIKPPNVGSHACNNLVGLCRSNHRGTYTTTFASGMSTSCAQGVDYLASEFFSYLDMIRGFSKIDEFFARLVT